ncbi:MAG: uroporphyrinogen-III synthase [Ilumatobacter sp.]
MTERAAGSPGALDGCTVVVTRPDRGELGRLLDAEGAAVVHVPLISVVDPDPREMALLSRCVDEDLDWVIVTSVAGADRVPWVAGRSDVRLAAVGTATARRLAGVAGRPVDLTPDRQLASALVEEFTRVESAPSRVLVAQADRAAPTLVDGLVEAGHQVIERVAYRTQLRVPTADERRMISTADAVTFASGSAALSWASALADDAPRLLPAIVASIGPTTSEVAASVGLTVTHQAEIHSLRGLVDTLCVAWRSAV